MRYNITKFLILLMCLYLLVLFFNQYDTSFSLSQQVNGTNLLYYTEISASENAICCGNLFINTKIENDAKVIGESIEIESEKLESVLKNLKFKFKAKEYIEANNLYVLYGFSDKIPNITHYGNYLTNLQIAVYENYCIIGWPMILGSF